ncbi:DUF3330 domain-containing protein [Thiofaba sp. EF100]|uniref:DUF3330 domain-containing protein n=1 Tax=Thiofaba sp. EF100 TaxID=3121274 RepID=UPI003221BDDC
MLYPRSSVDPEMVKCEVCLKEIPASESKNVEAVEYVMYFCGLECYAIWSRQDADQPRQEPPV